MEVILIYLCIAAIGLTLLMMVGFGLKNAGARMAGQSKVGLLAFALPLLIFIIAFAVDKTWEGAAVATAIAMTLSGFLALVISGARSLFS